MFSTLDTTKETIMQTAQQHAEYAFSPTHHEVEPLPKTDSRPTLRVIHGTSAYPKRPGPTAEELRAMYPEPGGRA